MAPYAVSFTGKTTMVLHIRSVILATALACASAHAAAAGVREDPLQFNTLKLSRLTLDDGAGPPVRYYLSTPTHKVPLVLYIQGSGCTPPFVGLGTPAGYSTIYSWLPLAAQGRYAVMAVDKPYQSDAPQQGPRGTATGCAGQFNEHFSYGAWLATLKQAVRHALTRPEVDPRRVLVIGTSEGATMAAGLARELPEITDVVLVGATGPTQLFDFAAGIHRSDGGDEDKARRLRELDDTFRAISADPTSTNMFAWGHTFLRWSSFFAQSAVDNLAHSKARVYLASGMQDKSVPIVSTEVLYAQLRARGKDVTFRRVPAAGHDLAPVGRPMPEAQKEYDAFMAWFEQAGATP